MGELRELARFVHDLTWEALPETVRQTAVFRTLDLVSVAMGAVKDSLVQSVLDSYRQRSGTGMCSVWGMDQFLPMAEAAR